jgi:hypothetical protein
MAPMIRYDARTPGVLIHRVDTAQAAHETQAAQAAQGAQVTQGATAVRTSYVLHDYGGPAALRTVLWRPFLNVPQSLYVVVLPLVETRSDTAHRLYPAAAVVAQYRHWLRQLRHALPPDASPPAVLTVLNTFCGVPLRPPEAAEAETEAAEAAEAAARRDEVAEEVRRQLRQCQEAPTWRATFTFVPRRGGGGGVTVDCRNEHDVASSVCAAIETWAAQQQQQRQLQLQLQRPAATFPVVEHLRDSFDRCPIGRPFVEETAYAAEVRRRLLSHGYRAEDELDGSLALLVRWWVADSLRARRILRLFSSSSSSSTSGPGGGQRSVIATSAEALGHGLLGPVVDELRRRSAVVIRRAAVRAIVRRAATHATTLGSMGRRIDAAELLVDVGLLTRIAAYDAVSGQVQLPAPPPATAASTAAASGDDGDGDDGDSDSDSDRDHDHDRDSDSDGDLFLAIGLIDQRVGAAHDLRPPAFRPETTTRRRIHRWYSLEPATTTTTAAEAAVVAAWAADVFVTLCRCVLSLLLRVPPRDVALRIFRDGLYAAKTTEVDADPPHRSTTTTTTTYIVRPYRDASLGDGVELIVDVSTDNETLPAATGTVQDTAALQAAVSACGRSCRRSTPRADAWSVVGTVMVGYASIACIRTRRRRRSCRLGGSWRWSGSCSKRNWSWSGS